MRYKICTKCKNKYLAIIKYFPPNKHTKDKLSSWCRICHRKAIQKYWQSNNGKIIHKKGIVKYRKTIKGYLRHIYADIKRRCTNSNYKDYKYYGGRGIQLKFTSDEFIDYVMNELQIDPRRLQIDRIDNNGNYKKGNIRFVTVKENLQNKRKKYAT